MLTAFLGPSNKLHFFLYHFSRNPINRYAEHVEEAPNNAGFRQYSPVHQDAVMSVAAVRPGITLSGSKDKVCLNWPYTVMPHIDRTP